MLTQAPAFTHGVPDHISSSPPSLREKVPTLSADIEKVVTKALAKRPEDRFPDVQTFADALKEAIYSAAPEDHRDIDNYRTIENFSVSDDRAGAIAGNDFADIIADTLPPIPPAAVQPDPQPNSKSTVSSRPIIVIPPASPVAPAIPAPPPQTKHRLRVSRRKVLWWIAIGTGVVITAGVGDEIWTHLHAHATSSGHGTPITTPEKVSTPTSHPTVTHTPTPDSDPTATPSGTTTVLAEDNFQRVSPHGWGRASDGRDTWRGDAQTNVAFSVQNPQGLIQTGSLAKPQTYESFLGGSSYTNATVLITGTVSDFTKPTYLAAMLRWDENNHVGYKAGLGWAEDNSSAATLFIDKRTLQGSVPLPLQSKPPSFRPSIDTVYTLKFQVASTMQGTTLQSEVWQGNADQTNPQKLATVIASDPDHPFISGSAGIRVDMVANTTIQISLFRGTSP